MKKLHQVSPSNKGTNRDDFLLLRADILDHVRGCRPPLAGLEGAVVTPLLFSQKSDK